MTSKKNIKAPSYKEGFKLITQLGEDLKDIVELRGTIREDLWRRLVVRTVFSYVDAVVSHARGRALNAHSQGFVKLTPKALKVISEGYYEITDDGTAIWTTKFPCFKDAIRTSLNSYAKAMGTISPLSAAAKWPKGFDEAITIRNQITHPKLLTDLEVTGVHMNRVGHISKWLQNLHNWIAKHEIAQINALKEKTTQDIQAQIDRLKKGKGR